MTENVCSSFSRWRVVPASVAGTSHQQRGLPCQDYHYWEILAPGILVAAVADGAGSATLAEVGSQVAAGAAVEAISQKYSDLHVATEDEASWQQLLLHGLEVARLSVTAEAAVRDTQVRELATTLILVVATPQLVAAAQVGDGAAVIQDRQNNLITLTAPQSGEFINETTFLIANDALSKAQVTVWQGQPTQLAVFSDGLQLLALQMSDGIPYQPFFAPLFRFAAEATDEGEARQQLQQFLSSERVTQRTDDDVTLFLATLVN